MEACLFAYAQQKQSQEESSDVPTVVKEVFAKTNIKDAENALVRSSQGLRVPQTLIDRVNIMPPLVKVYVPLPFERLNVQKWECNSCKCILLCNGETPIKWSCRMCPEGIFEMDDFPEPPTQRVICGWCARSSHFSVEDMRKSHGYVCGGCEQNSNFIVMCAQSSKKNTTDYARLCNMNSLV